MRVWVDGGARSLGPRCPWRPVRHPPHDHPGASWRGCDAPSSGTGCLSSPTQTHAPESGAGGLWCSVRRMDRGGCIVRGAFMHTTTRDFHGPRGRRGERSPVVRKRRGHAVRGPKPGIASTISGSRPGILASLRSGKDCLIAAQGRGGSTRGQGHDQDAAP
jgi:hypothetical protein